MAANAFVTQPQLPEPFPNVPRFWTCPRTGLKVPKRLDENLQWRAELLQAAERDVGLQNDLFTACAISPLFWVNAFVWTFVVQEIDEAGKRRSATSKHRPMVTWEVQDRHMLELEASRLGGYDLLTDKTRDMGASWNHVVMIDHPFIFESDFMALEMSRVETDVDNAANPRCLFAKHDYIHRWLPRWMCPAECLPGGSHRRVLSMSNPRNGSRIDGESSNKAAGSGDRRNVVLLDEFAKMENATKIKAATADVTPSRWVNSTPWGPGREYSKWRQSGQIKVFVLPWWEHPEKGLGRYAHQDEMSEKWKIRSPWYDKQAETRSPQEMAVEIDMDHLGSGSTFFEAPVIEAHKLMHVREPHGARRVDFKKRTILDDVPKYLGRRDVKSVAVTPNGPLKLWTKLIKGRLDQTKNYVLGIDISKGQGASNSVISIFCVETKEKVAEWVDAKTPPYDLARIACALALWVGGQRSLPLMIWEANGPGWDFGREVVQKYQYPRYYVDRVIGNIVEKRGKRYGWHSSKAKKEAVLGSYRRALAHGGFINHSERALDEALTYVYYATGGSDGIGPASLEEESDNARKTHGDRVIADMLALEGSQEVPTATAPVSVPPQRSFAGRKKMYERKRRQARQSRGRSFDYRSKHAG